MVRAAKGVVNFSCQLQANTVISLHQFINLWLTLLHYLEVNLDGLRRFRESFEISIVATEPGHLTVISAAEKTEIMKDPLVARLFIHTEAVEFCDLIMKQCKFF